MGRRKQPAGLQEAMGNPGRRKAAAPTTSPKRSAKSVDAAIPYVLKGREFTDARKVWERIAPELIRSNIMTPTDFEAFGRYCVHVADWAELSKTIKREGRTQTVKTTSGDEMVRMHPAVKARELAEKRMIDLEDRFGLNPRYRMAIMRDMNALPGFGGLFDRQGHDDKPDHTAEPAEPVAPAEIDDDDDIIGFGRSAGGSGLPN